MNFWVLFHQTWFTCQLHHGVWIFPKGFAQIFRTWVHCKMTGHRFNGEAWTFRSMQHLQESFRKISVRRISCHLWGAFTHHGHHLIYEAYI